MSPTLQIFNVEDSDNFHEKSNQENAKNIKKRKCEILKKVKNRSTLSSDVNNTKNKTNKSSINKKMGITKKRSCSPPDLERLLTQVVDESQLDYLPTSATEDYFLRSEKEEPKLFSVVNGQLQPIDSQFLMPGIYKNVPMEPNTPQPNADSKRNPKNVFITDEEKYGRIVSAKDFQNLYVFLEKDDDIEIDNNNINDDKQLKKVKLINPLVSGLNKIKEYDEQLENIEMINLNANQNVDLLNLDALEVHMLNLNRSHIIDDSNGIDTTKTNAMIVEQSIDNVETRKAQELIVEQAFAADMQMPTKTNIDDLKSTETKTENNVENDDIKLTTTANLDTLTQSAINLLKMAKKDHIVIDSATRCIVRTKYDTNRKTIYIAKGSEILNIEASANTSTRKLLEKKHLIERVKLGRPRKGPKIPTDDKTVTTKIHKKIKEKQKIVKEKQTNSDVQDKNYVTTRTRFGRIVRGSRHTSPNPTGIIDEPTNQLNLKNVQELYNESNIDDYYDCNYAFPNAPISILPAQTIDCTTATATTTITTTTITTTTTTPTTTAKTIKAAVATTTIPTATQTITSTATQTIMSTAAAAATTTIATATATATTTAITTAAITITNTTTATTATTTTTINEDRLIHENIEDNAKDVGNVDAISSTIVKRRVPPEAICPTCKKCFLGRRLQRHFTNYPDHMILKPPISQQQQLTTEQLQQQKNLQTTINVATTTVATAASATTTATANTIATIFSTADQYNINNNNNRTDNIEIGAGVTELPADNISLFRFLISKLQKCNLNEDQRADLFLNEINDFVQELQLRSSRIIRNTSGLHFVTPQASRVLGIPEGQYALDMSAIESPPETDPEPESEPEPTTRTRILNYDTLNGTTITTTPNVVDPRNIDYTAFSMSMDDTITDEAAQKLNLSVNGKLLPPSEESLLRAVDDFVDLKKLGEVNILNTKVNSHVNNNNDIETLVPHYDHVSDNAMEAMVPLKETIGIQQTKPLLDLSVDFFQIKNM